MEELPVEIFAHLIENEPVTDRAVRDEALDQIQILTSLEISEMKVEVLPFKNCDVSLFAICFLKLTLWSFLRNAGNKQGSVNIVITSKHYTLQ